MKQKSTSLALLLSVIICSCSQPQQKADAPQYPDGTVFQATSDGAVYMVVNGKRHHVPNPPTLAALGIRPPIAQQPDSFVRAIPEGEPLPNLPGNVIQKGGTGEIYLLESGKRRYIPNPETLTAMGLDSKVHGVPDPVANAIPLGAPVPPIGGVQRAAPPKAATP